MLKLNSVADEDRTKVSVAFDYYVTLDVSIEISDPPPENLYWRALYRKRSLVEIGVDSRSGIVVSITMPFVDRERFEEVGDLGELPESTSGVPVVRLDHWKDEPREYSDQFRDFELPMLFRYDRASAWLLLTEGPCSRFVRAGRVLFGFSAEEELVRTGVADLSSDEFQTVGECRRKP